MSDEWVYNALGAGAAVGIAAILNRSHPILWAAVALAAYLVGWAIVAFVRK